MYTTEAQRQKIKENYYTKTQAAIAKRTEKQQIIDEKRISEEKRIEFFKNKTNRDNERNKYFEENREYINNCLEDILDAMETKRKSKWFTQYFKDRVYVNQFMKPFILNRDNYTCPLCNLMKDYSGLIVHHIIPVNKDKSLVKEETNIVSLCKKCHLKVHKKRWKDVDENISEKLTIYIEGIYNF